MNSEDIVNDALRKTKYNETVSIAFGDDQEVSLTPCLDKGTGGITYQQIQPGTRIQRELQTKQWFFPMLNDTTRNNTYLRAIKLALEKQKKVGHILDIGTGTGLLAMMAATVAPQAQITSLEMSTCFADLARETIATNNIKNVQVVCQHSTTVNVDVPADLCLSELLEDGLLGEGWLPTMRDAWQRNLQPDCTVLPRSARVYAQLVEAKWLQDYCGPRDFSHKDTEVRFCLDSSGTTALVDPLDVVLPVNAEYLIRTNKINILSEPWIAFDIDVSDPSVIPDPNGRQFSHSVVAATSGTLHGILVYWDLEVYENLVLSTRPGSSPFQDHWRPCLHVVPPQSISAGDTIELQISHNDERIFVQTLDSSMRKQGKRAKVDRCSPVVSPQRALQLNDTQKLITMRDALSKVLASGGLCSKSSLVSESSETARLILDVSDFSLLSLMSSKFGAKDVVSVENSDNGLPLTAAKLVQLGNNIQEHLEILQCRNESLQHAIGSKSSTRVDLVLGEPYYEILEGWHLLEALNFYWTIQYFRTQDLIGENTTIFPSRCTIWACVIESDQLKTAYSACGDETSKICGLDHSSVNQHGDRFHEYDLNLPMWQYDHRRLCEPQALGVLDYSSIHCDKKDATDCRVEFSDLRRDGRCDALLIWVEYSVENKGSSLGGWSTNNRYHKQLVRRLPASRFTSSQPGQEEPVRSIQVTTHFIGRSSRDDSSILEPYRLEVVVNGYSSLSQIQT